MLQSRSVPRLALTALYASSQLFFGAEAGAIQKAGLKLPSTAAANAALVRNAFSSAYNDYKAHAYGHDDLAPVSGGYVDSRDGWGATIVDGMTTMQIMGLTDDFNAAVNYSLSINFNVSKTGDSVSLFETTIRYLGGMLSAYELSGKTNKALITQAVNLGNKLAHAWVGNNTLPYNTLNFGTDVPSPGVNNVAQAGTLVLEFSRLSLYSGNATYKALADKAMKTVATTTPPLPGLAAQNIDPSTNKFTDDYITWGGGTDSYLEYLIKYARLTNNADPTWVETWKTAVDSSIKYLATTSTVGGHLYLTDYTGGAKRYIGSHLECFVGGNWIMGGKMLNNATIVNYGLKLVDACINTYQSDVTGIGPEVFAYNGTDGGSYTGGPGPSASDLAFYKQHGFYVYDGYSYWDLRPEVLESNFYAWRATGDIKYYNNAVTAMHAIFNNTKAPLAYAPINNVQQLNSGFIDDTESFFFAEVMKYIYLTFDDPKHISLDSWVFNTECHPFLAPAALADYNPKTKTTPRGGFEKLAGAPVPSVSPNPRLPKQLQNIYNQVGTAS